MKKGFDNDKYLQMQSEHIRERIAQFDNKLYLEFGGKLFDDYHASRVLPGFQPDSKLQMLLQLKDQAEVVIVINAEDIVSSKVRGDYGITYDLDVLRLIDAFQERGLFVGSVCVTMYTAAPEVEAFEKRLNSLGIRTFRHYKIPGYPNDVARIVSDEGYGRNEYIETQRPLVVITAPGPGSGKMATCLSQLYHEYKRGVKAGYAKFETFPIWDLPVGHMVNIAYEAATVDLKDEVLIDEDHLKAYHVQTVNYKRDIESFHLLKTLIEKITGREPMYQSPTDMGVNRLSSGILDDAVITEASRQEIIRRYLRCSVEYAMGLVEKEILERAGEILKRAGARLEDRKVVIPAREAARKAEINGKGNEGVFCGAAVELHDGTIITGKNSQLLHSASALILNATKHLAGLPDNLYLVPQNIIDSVNFFKKEILNGKMVSLDVEETLIVLAISALSNPAAKMALENLKWLQNCEVHLTHIPTPGDEAGLRKLRVNLTCDPEFSSKNLYVND